MDQFFQFDWSFIDRVGNSPFQAMWFFFLNGGWIAILISVLWLAVQGWRNYKQNIFNAKKQWIVLSIQVPRMHEQTPSAIDNMFAYIAGAHSANSWTEEWIIGRTQDTVSFEIVSIDGHVQFMIRTTRALRDLVEAAIYSQYPDADITQVEDYAYKVPADYPNEEWNVWGTQFKLIRPDFFPIKTYPSFEDKVSGEFKDPLSAMLESLSRLGPGEQAWFQIMLLPIGQGEFQKKSELLVKKLTGQKVEAKKSMLEHAADLPLKAMGAVVEGAFGAASTAPPKKEMNPLLSKMLHMTQGEKDTVSAIENKAGKMVFSVKMRFVYVAKKAVMSNARIVNSFMGSMRQFNTNNMNSLKPDFAKVGTNGSLLILKQFRNDIRRTNLVRAYRNRSDWSGLARFHLCSEELATLWHFPLSMQVKSPQLKKTESKKSEPPANIPFG